MEIASDEPILSVSDVNREARLLLESALPAVWVEGEISNFLRHGSGHLYFALKDADAQVRCAMFRGANRGLAFRPGDGQRVLVNARVTVYEARGTYQLVVQHMEPAGEGLLRRRFEELKARLAAEGLFALERKRPLPSLPRRIGIVTSPSGAAVRDILNVLRRRFPAIPVLLYPVAVQGERAAPEIAAALDRAGSRGDCDVLIVGRGGGSLEDLWAFNEEIVVRAIHACPIPVVSAVGHETDITLADLVADLRAPTPSAAAEQVVPDSAVWRRRVDELARQLERLTRRRLSQQRDALARLDARLERCHPAAVLQQRAQRLDELTLRARRALQQQLGITRTRLDHARSRLGRAAPTPLLARLQQQLNQLDNQLEQAVKDKLRDRSQRLAVLAAELQGVSPLATLERGYAVITDAKGKVLRDAAGLKPDQTITGRLARGQFQAKVVKNSEG